MVKRRRDSKGIMLKKGESERAGGGYDYRWTQNGERRVIYAPTLQELREKKEEISADVLRGIRPNARNLTVNDIYKMWVRDKMGLKDNTMLNYMYMYEMFVNPYIGKSKISGLLYSDVKGFYNMLYRERGLKVSTIDNVNTVLHQVLELAVQNRLIPANPSDNAIRELKHMHGKEIQKRQALTAKEQELFLDYLRSTPRYQHWYPVFLTMLYTGLRVGEITGLRWCDVDLENGFISVNHTLVYYKHDTNKCQFSIHKPKTEAGIRSVPIMSEVREALEQEKEYQDIAGLRCKVKVDGFSDFIFINRFGNVHNQNNLNRALRRIIRDCNKRVLSEAQDGENVTLLPDFSCHTLRHTFATRMCEIGINLKVIQDVLGHSDFSTTMNVYTDATSDFKKKEFQTLEKLLKGGSAE